uniref:BTB domain-containing protein n=1 Tax=Parastrongyloides trichosuri TaxID=131310 RepID=A0A0N4ZJS4_PARTI
MQGQTNNSENLVLNNTWEIDSFGLCQQMHQTSEFMESLVFGTGDKRYNYFVRLYPNGISNEWKDYLSLDILMTNPNYGVSVITSKITIKTQKKMFVKSPEVCEILKNCHDIDKTWLDGDFSDFVVKCNGVEFKVHRNVLATRSHFFGKLLNKKQSQESLSGEITLNNFSSGVLKELLRYLYTGKLAEEWMNVEMLCTASHLQCNLLKSYVEHSLISKTNELTVNDYLRHANLLDCNLLKAHCEKYIEENS